MWSVKRPPINTEPSVSAQLPVLYVHVHCSVRLARVPSWPRRLGYISANADSRRGRLLPNWFARVGRGQPIATRQRLRVARWVIWTKISQKICAIFFGRFWLIENIGGYLFENRSGSSRPYSNTIFRTTCRRVSAVAVLTFKIISEAAGRCLHLSKTELICVLSKVPYVRTYKWIEVTKTLPGTNGRIS